MEEIVEPPKKRDKKNSYPQNSRPLEFSINGRWERARCASLKLPHYTCATPMFMPVGTQGTVKALTPDELEQLDVHLILGNTYHLGHRPGGDVVEGMGRLHNFINWDRAMLTDSGGFQMVSLLKFANITEEGVEFESPHDGSTMVLTPEHSMHLQNQLGADIMMALDDVVHSTTTGPRVEEAMYRTIRWIDRCIEAHKRPEHQNLFGIVQGGLDENLREICMKELIKRDLPGYAIGGLSGGEDKNQFWRVVAQCCKGLPENKPRYVMGVGYAVDIVVCVALGVDMFDCVFPTRTARFGTALVSEGGKLNLKLKKFRNDMSPIDKHCGCLVCQKYTRAYLHTVAAKEDTIGSQLITYHNIAYQMRLMREIREAIRSHTFPEYVKQFFSDWYPNGRKDYPQWALDALLDAGIEL